MVVVAALTDGRPGVVGAGVRGSAHLVVFALGIAAVGIVARLLPGASMLVALMTYALQLIVAARWSWPPSSGAGWAPTTLSRGWFAAAVIVVALTWVVGQLVVATRQRIPVYDLPLRPRRPGRSPRG